MKRVILLCILCAAAISAYSQTGSQAVSGIKYRVNDTTTYQSSVAAAHTQGYADIYFNNQAVRPHFDVWNGSSYNHVFEFSGGGGVGTVTNVSGTSPINVATGTTTPVISIDNAAADGSTKGAASFNSNYFNDDGSGIINVDLTNGAASASQGGYMTTGAQTFAGVKSFSAQISGSINGNAGSASTLNTPRNISMTGDVTWTTSFDGSGNSTGAGTLATVNSNVSTFGSATQASQVTVNAKGLTTAASNVTITPAFGSVTGGTAGSIMYSNGTSLTQNNTNLFWDNTNGRLRINNSGSASFAAPQTGTLLHFVSQSSTFNGRSSLDSYVDTQSTGSIYQGRTARGTIASPSAAVVDQVLAAYGGDGYGATGFHGSSVGAFTVRSDGTMTDTSAPTYLTLSTTPSASTTSTERFRIGSAGQLGIGGATYGTSGQAMISGGSAAAPTWGSIGSGGVDNTIWKVGGNTLSGAAVLGSTSAQDITMTVGNGNYKVAVNGTQTLNINSTRGWLFDENGGTITALTTYDFRPKSTDSRTVRMASTTNQTLWTLGAVNGEMFMGTNTGTYIGPGGQGSEAATGTGLVYRASQSGGHHFKIGASNMGNNSQIDETTTAGNMVAVTSTTGFWHRIRPGFENTTTQTAAAYSILSLSPTFNLTTGSSTLRVLDYNPTETSLTGGTIYGITIGGTNWKNGFGTRTPTALVHIGAGSTSLAPAKHTSGSLLTTIEDGAKEYNGDHYESTSGLNRLGHGGPIVDFITDANNTSTTETDLYTYTTKASTLSVNGAKLVFDVAGTLNDITATSQIQFYFAGTLIGNTGALTMSVTGAWSARVMVIRTGTTTARASVTISTPGASTASYTSETDLTGLTFTNTNIIKVTGTAGGASGGSSDITAKLGTVIYWPAAAN